MIARLARFYGGSPWHWFAELPLGLVRGCARMLPRLQAEEAFAGMAVNTGHLQDEAFKAVTRRWREVIEPTGARPRQRVNPHALAAIGIGFRRGKAAPKVPNDG
jgi:hypothetical protein